MNLNDDSPFEYSENFVTKQEEKELRISLIKAIKEEFKILEEDSSSFYRKFEGKKFNEVDPILAIEKLANKQIRNSLDRILSRWLNGSKYEYDKEKLRFNKVDENDFKK